MSDLPESAILKGITWLGPRRPATGSYKADTFPVTWGDDDVIYSAGGDPVSEEKRDGLNFVSIEGSGESYGFTVINDMLFFRGWGGHGLKPTGLLCREGVLYLLAHNLGRRENENAEKCHGYDAHVFRSADKGKTWTPDIRTVEKSPMLPGRDFGSPHFINYGKNHAGSVDGYVYVLSGQGWAQGTYLKVARVPADKIADIAAWQFVSRVDASGEPIWASDSTAATPVLSDDGFLGYPECIYIASLDRYLLLGWRFKVERPDKYSPDDGSELAIYEAPKPWGPYSVVAKLDWETPEVTPYNPRVPLKWFDQDKLEGYLLFSGSWRNGGSSEFYRGQTRRFRLERRGSLSTPNT